MEHPTVAMVIDRIHAELHNRADPTSPTLFSWFLLVLEFTRDSGDGTDDNGRPSFRPAPP